MFQQHEAYVTRNCVVLAMTFMRWKWRVETTGPAGAVQSDIADLPSSLSPSLGFISDDLFFFPHYSQRNGGLRQQVTLPPQAGRTVWRCVVQYSFLDLRVSPSPWYRSSTRKEAGGAHLGTVSQFHCRIKLVQTQEAKAFNAMQLSSVTEGDVLYLDSKPGLDCIISLTV
jgi:hypothetical protein